MTAKRRPDRSTGILSGGRGGLITFLIEAAVVVIAIVLAAVVAAIALAMV